MIDINDAKVVVMDEDVCEKLVKVDNDIFDDWRLLIDKDGNTYMLVDEQGAKPNTLEEARDYDWIDMVEWAGL